jgi:hypothetical protein
VVFASLRDENDVIRTVSTETGDARVDPARQDFAASRPNRTFNHEFDLPTLDFRSSGDILSNRMFEWDGRDGFKSKIRVISGSESLCTACRKGSRHSKFSNEQDSVQMPECVP